jgi:membrane protease subunit (stomatin/prohibitin family)
MDAARAQLQAKAGMTNYVQEVDMSADAYVQAPMAASNMQAAKKLCGSCGAEIGNAKFCPECGKPAVAAAPTHCPQCGAETKGAKFCRECGTKLTA